MTFQVTCQHGGCAGTRESAASLDYRVYPDVENAHVTHQESPATLVLTSPLINYARRHGLHNMCYLIFIEHCQSFGQCGFMILPCLCGVRHVRPPCEAGVNYCSILCAFDLLRLKRQFPYCYKKLTKCSELLPFFFLLLESFSQ